jgi:hypothetical protein
VPGQGNGGNNQRRPFGGPGQRSGGQARGGVIHPRRSGGFGPRGNNAPGSNSGQPSHFVSNILKGSGLIFFCKDCEKVVDVIPLGKKFVYKCAICKTKNVAFGTEKSVKNFFKVEVAETPAEPAKTVEQATSQTTAEAVSGVAAAPVEQPVVAPVEVVENGKPIPEEGAER